MATVNSFSLKPSLTHQAMLAKAFRMAFSLEHAPAPRCMPSFYRHPDWRRRFR